MDICSGAGDVVVLGVHRRPEADKGHLSVNWRALKSISTWLKFEEAVNETYENIPPPPTSTLSILKEEKSNL